MSLRQRLRTALAIKPANEKREKALLEELEQAKQKMDELNEKIMRTENEKVYEVITNWPKISADLI